MDRGFVTSLVSALAVAAFATGCAGMSSTEQRVLSGGAIGAASGAVIGGLTGHAGTGAAIGGAAGAAGGYVYDKSEERRDR